MSEDESQAGMRRDDPDQPVEPVSGEGELYDGGEIPRTDAPNGPTTPPDENEQ